MKRPRKIALKLLLFLLAGAIINVGVAWGIAFTIREPIGETNFGNGLVIDGIEYEEEFEASTGFFLAFVIAMRGTRPAEGHYMQLVDSRGWPLVSLRSHQRYKLVNLEWRFVNASGLIFLGENTRAPVSGLPLRIAWPGFAINTIFYAAIVWVLFAVPGVVRRRVRRKRGQCAACGYSLRGTPHIEKCPECGATA